MKTYDELAEELEALAHSTDGEERHIHADRKLTAVITRAALTGEPPTPGQSNRIIAAFDSIPKWYA